MAVLCSLFDVLSAFSEPAQRVLSGFAQEGHVAGRVEVFYNGEWGTAPWRSNRHREAAAHAGVRGLVSKPVPSPLGGGGTLGVRSDLFMFGGTVAVLGAPFVSDPVASGLLRWLRRRGSHRGVQRAGSNQRGPWSVGVGEHPIFLVGCGGFAPQGLARIACG